MNVYVVPSWYPNPRQPMSGIFTKEQSRLISNHPSIDKVIIQDHGYTISHLTPLNITGIFKSIYWRCNVKKEIFIEDNFVEIFDPLFTWPEKIPFGGIDRLVKHSKKIFKEALKKFGEIDIIHAHVCFPAGYIAYELSKSFDIPYIITEHMGPFPFSSITDRNGILKNEINLAFMNSKKIIAVSDELKQEMQSYGIQNIQVIGNLVDEDFFKIKEKNINKVFTFFSLGRLHPQKGFDTLLKAIEVLKTKEIHVNFRIGGEGPAKSKYKMIAKNLGISSYISWLGELSREEALSEYQSCDAYILASQHESFGMTYIEALSCGKPVIATKCGAPEKFINKNNGLLVEKENHVPLAKAITEVIDNTNYKPDLIREECIKNYSKKNIINQIIDIYRGV